MTYFDRFTGQIIAKLPRHMDLGRFAVIDKGIICDLTNADAVQMGDYVVRESLFEETNQNIHDLLQTIAANYIGNINNIAPIIQKFNIFWFAAAFDTVGYCFFRRCAGRNPVMN